MNQFAQLGKVFVFLGIGFVAFGTLMLIAAKFKTIGHLPGDIYIQKKNYTVYFSLTTSIILSIIISFLFWIFSKK
ncbi:MAG: DUF2905 domain-containing protein [Candidatus Omnitrophica bacterium]|nr:DUF2905 domain-containing protein [Candidatus Omnitrophota bacterium]